MPSYYEERDNPLDKARKERQVNRLDGVMFSPVKGRGDLTSEGVYRFLYEAESPGVKPKYNPGMENSLYDAFPCVILLNIENRNSNILFTGLNINYLEKRVIDRGRVIFSWRRDTQINPVIFEKCIHSYRLDRVRGKVYRARNATADLTLLNSNPDFERVRIPR